MYVYTPILCDLVLCNTCPLYFDFMTFVSHACDFLTFVQAKRADVTCVILPEENRRDVDDLPDFIKKGVEFHFVRHYSEVYDIIFDS